MMRRLARIILIAVCVFANPWRCPAPLIYTPGEGWTYEPVGSEGKWRRGRAKDQLEAAQAAFEKKDYGVALKASRRVVNVWPLSDYAPQAQYLAGRCYEAKGNDEKAFREYQKVLETYPKIPNYGEILQRQFEIATRFLNGKRFRVFGYIPMFRSMGRTADMYAKVVKNGPYSELAPQAQLNIGTAKEREKTLGLKTPDYPGAAKAYAVAADRYHDRPEIAAEALFREARAHEKQAQKAEYDQTQAGEAISIYTDFITLYPNEPRVPKAQETIASLKTEQARGNFEIARFYEKYKRWGGALVYYNEVMLHDPESSYAAQARERIDIIKRRVAGN